MTAERWPQSERSPFALLGDVLERLAGVPDRIAGLERQLRDGTMPEKRLLTVAEAADLAGMSERTMWTLVKKGSIPVRVVDSETRLTRIALSDLDAWVDSLPRREP